MFSFPQSLLFRLRPGALLLWVCGLAVGALPSSLAASAIQGSALTFEKEIRPILKANCFDCHGEGEKPKGGLDLRLRRWMLRGGESGAAIVPGNAKKSHLIELVRSGEMPKREKKLTSLEIATLEAWISAGAKTARSEPESITTSMVITEEERSHWAFQPIRRPAIPPSRPRDHVRNPVDALLLGPLHARKLEFSPDTDSVTLLRRLHFDLVGLPPTPEDISRFLADTSTGAYEREMDRLLASPQYGERWGRHWLDAAGYADSDGYAADDNPRPYAYKFRDYVIRAFNSDKPFDQFVVEQIAGDELVAPPYKNLSAPQLEKLIATGFLRMGADGTANAADQDTARNQVVADTLKIVSSSLLGLTVGCAQCHDHRYDPIPHTDYHRLRAVFEPAYDWKHWRNPGERLVSLYTDEDRTRAAAVETEAGTLAKERATKEESFITAALDKELEKFEEPLRTQLREAYRAAGDKRSQEQQRLLKENPSVNISGGTLYQYNQKAADELKALDGKIAEVRGRKPIEDFVSVLTETPGTVPVTYLFHRGDPHQPKEPIQPGALSVLEAPGHPLNFLEKEPSIPSTGRRLAFARWVASTNNPLFARVVMNRVWMHHFGRGLVRTPADFGAMGEKPTHPELLDWLASEFAAQGWSFKAMHRLILTSTAYRQSSARAALEPVGKPQTRPRFLKGQALDPDANLYGRKPVLRLDAEAVRDAILSVSGALSSKMFGPPVPVRPDATGQIVVGVDKTEGDNRMPVEVPLNGDEYRRSVYIQVRRSRPLAMLNAFDAPVMEVNCEKRQSSTVAPQALMLMNSLFILEQAEKFADRLIREAGPDRRQQLVRGWELAYSRRPQESSLRAAIAFLDAQVAHLRAVDAADAASVGETKAKDKAKDGKMPAKPNPEVQALRDLCQVLLSSNEFLYVD